MLMMAPLHASDPAYTIAGFRTGKHKWSALIIISCQNICWKKVLFTYSTVNCSQTRNPDSVLIVAGGFNQVNIKKVVPNFHQHDCATRG